MALSCIVISPELEMPNRISAFLESAHFFQLLGLYANWEKAEEALAAQTIEYVLVELHHAEALLAVIKHSLTANLPRFVIFGPEESYFIDGNVHDPSVFQNLNEIPTMLNHMGKNFTTYLPHKLRVPKDCKINFDIAKAVEKPVWMLLKPNDWTFELRDNSANAIYVRAEGDIRRVRLSELLLIEAQKDYLKLRTAKDSFRILKSMKKMEKFLNPQTHGRIHRSYIVQLNAIHTIDNEHVWLDGIDFPIPIGPSYRKELLASLEIL